MRRPLCLALVLLLALAPVALADDPAPAAPEADVPAPPAPAADVPAPTPAAPAADVPAPTPAAPAADVPAPTPAAPAADVPAPAAPAAGVPEPTPPVAPPPSAVPDEPVATEPVTIEPVRMPEPRGEPIEAFADEEETDLDLPSGGAAEPDLMAIPLRKPTKDAVLGIKKTHNVTWRCDCKGLALRLDLLFALADEKGMFVGATVDFFDSRGVPLQSVHLPFANKCGQISVWTRLVKMDVADKYMRTCLVIPYKAFPCSSCSPSYDVEARVRLLRRTGTEVYRTLATGSTTFTVTSESPDEPRDWKDYNKAHGAAETSCKERQRRFLNRASTLKDAHGSPKRAQEMWKPFCPIPAA